MQEEGGGGGRERDSFSYSEHCIEADSNIADIVHSRTV